MKKKILALISLCLLCGCSTYTRTYGYKKPLYMYDIEAIASVVTSNVTYTNDLDELGGHVDYWQTPEETRIRGLGDCEDFAFYLSRLLKDKGYTSWVILGAGPEDYGHAWVEIQTEDGIWVICGKTYGAKRHKIEAGPDWHLTVSKYKKHLIGKSERTDITKSVAIRLDMERETEL